MPDTKPIRTPPAAQVLEAPPRHPPAPVEPCSLVIFGAGGDLTKRLVMPALYNLSHNDRMPKSFALIGVDMAPGTSESWAHHLHDALNGFVNNASSEFDIDRIDETAWNRLSRRMSYLQGDLTKPDTYQKLRGLLGGGRQEPQERKAT